MTTTRNTLRAWQITLALYIGLLAGIGIDHVWLRPLFHWPVWLIQTLPLLALLPGLSMQRSRSAIWLCFMLLLYFLIYVEHAALDNANRGAYVGLIMLCITLFTSAMLFARWRMRQLAAEIPDDPANTGNASP